MSSHIPKRAFSLEQVKPHEKLYEVSIILKDIPGALAQAAKVLADAGVNLKTGSVFYIPGQSGTGSWASFIDVSKATQSIHELERKLRKLEVVKDITFEKPEPAPFESIHFPILHGKARAVIMPVGTFWALIDRLERILTPSGLAAVHYDAGKNIGKHTATHLRETYGVEGTKLILAGVQVLKATGWGIVKVQEINFKQLSGTVTIKECFEAAAWRKKPYKACHWTRGYIAGFISEVFGKPVETVEVKCQTTGDEYCEFKIQTKI